MAIAGAFGLRTTSNVGGSSWVFRLVKSWLTAFANVLCWKYLHNLVDKCKREIYLVSVKQRENVMTKLPPVLAAEFCADCVEDIPLDVRLSTADAIRRMSMNADKFPNADWDAIDRKEAAILSVADAWYR